MVSYLIVNIKYCTGERTGPMLRRPEGPLDDRFGPGPSMFHPDDRMPIVRIS